VEAVRWYAAALSEMGNEARLAIPALVTVYLEDVDVVRAIARDVLNKIATNLDIIPINRLIMAKRRASRESCNTKFGTK
jgi:hypothetical protein